MSNVHINEIESIVNTQFILGFIFGLILGFCLTLILVDFILHWIRKSK